ncbi:YggT family protein [Vulgatibacter sp.]|uniref:YggT family protein n=1 Tax=Vulgatibacter sp. TaxID=1971226 RepID=UPI0035663C37
MSVMVAQFLNLVWIVVLVRVILSWVVRDPENPLVRFVGTLTDPWMRPLSRHLTFGGLDLSPMVVLIGIRVVQRMLLSA